MLPLLLKARQLWRDQVTALRPSEDARFNPPGAIANVTKVRTTQDTVELTFDHDVDTSTLDRVDAVQASAWTDPRHLRLTVAGPMAPVLRAIAPLDPVDLLARPADLDKLFLGYYRSTDLQEA